MGVAQGFARSVHGRVAEVLVELFSVPEDFGRHLPVKDRAKLAELGAVRLGSEITNARGEFRIEFGSPLDGRGIDRDKPVNLWLSGSLQGTDGSIHFVHQETAVRVRAGLSESFVVVVPEKDSPVKPPPDPRTNPEDLERSADAQRKLSGAFAATAKPDYAKRAARKRTFVNEVAHGLLAEISTVVRNSDGQPADEDYVEPGAPVRERAEDRLKKRLGERFDEDAAKPLLLTGRVSLTDKQLATVKQRGTLATDGSVEIAEDDLRAVLQEDGALNPVAHEASMTRVEVVQSYCRGRTRADLCLHDEEDEDHDDPTNGSTNGSPGGTNGSPGGTHERADLFDDINADELLERLPGFVSHLLNERSVLDTGLDLLKRPGEQLTEADLQAQATFPGLSLPPGPADTPAMYDFPKLQIAFKPLWTEALDDKLLVDAQAAYDHYVELGGDPSALVGTSSWGEFTSQVSVVFFNPPPPDVVAHFGLTTDEWNVLPTDYRAKMQCLAELVATLKTSIQVHGAAIGSFFGFDSDNVESFNAFVRHVQTRIAVYEGEAQHLVEFARGEIERRASTQSVVPTHRILTALKSRALGQYPARYFAANRKERSVNFGLLVTYRQRWTPTAYQVGELIKSLAMAPNETRKYSKKVTMKEKRSKKEVTSNLSAQKSETKSTSRAEAEIVQRAQQKTNYSANVSGSFKIGIYDAQGANTLNSDAGADSAETKKSMHEASVSAAREYKDELKVELEFESTFDSEIQESGEISNPNQELTITYLFYELQRRFRVTERLHRLQSVVLVAQEMPQPSEIDEDWIIAHRWILNRVLLDDGFKLPLAYVVEGLSAEEHSLSELKRALAKQSQLVEDLKGEVGTSRELTEQRYGALQRSMERSARATQRSSDRGGLLGFAKQLTSLPILESFAEKFIGADNEEPEAARVREAAARDAYERELERLRDLEGRLAHESNTLANATREYADRISAHLGRVVRVAELQAHIKDNIIHYMQAIWLHEPPDQRWLRLKDVPVPDLTARRRVNIHVEAVAGALGAPAHTTARMYRYTARCGTTPVSGALPTRPLIEVADIDNLLGFKANYMIFGLKKPNPLTSFMMQPYVEQAAGGFGITDPDDLGNISLDEFGDYVCCLKKRLTADQFAGLKDTLEAQLATLLQAPLRDDEEIIVPLDAMYIEALPGSRPLLENFKLLHRQIDAADAQENLRLKKMEKLRYAQRLLAGELDDPDVTANYTFEGAPGVAVTPPSPGGGGGGGP